MRSKKICARAAAVISAAAMAMSTAVCTSADSGVSADLIKSGAKAVDEILQNGTGYQGRLTVSPSEVLSETLGLEEALKDIDFSFDASVDGSLVGLNGTLNYGDGTLGSVEVVADRDSNRIYLRIPELSEDYLYVDVDDIDTDEEEDIDETISDSVSEINWSDLSSLTDLNPLQTVSSLEKGLNALGGYINSAAALLGNPSGTSVASGDVQGVEYTYTAVTYTLNYAQMSQLADSLSAAAKDDENVAALAEMLGYETEADGDIVSAMINDYVWENLEDGDEKTATYTVNIYMSGTDLKGFSFDNTAVSKSVLTAADGSTAAYETKKSYTEYGEYSNEYTGLVYTVGEDGSVSGREETTESYEDIETGESYESKEVTTFDNVIFGENTVKGKITTEGYDDGELSYTSEITLDVTADKQSVVYTNYSDGQLVLKITYDGENTDGKTVSLPDGNLYNALDEDELNAYLENSNLDEFKANAKAVLGDELYELLFSEDSMGSDSEDPDDSDDNSVIAPSENSSINDLGNTLTSTADSDTSSGNSSASASAASSSASSKADGDASPNTGSAAAGLAVVVLAAGAVAVSKRK